MVRSGDFLRVPFFLRKNGHESIDSLYTLREFALAVHRDILALSVSYGRSEGNRQWNDGVAEMDSSEIGRGFQKMVDWM